MTTTLADGPFTGAPTWFVALFIICGVGALILAGLRLIVGGFRALAAARRYRVYRRAGLSPMTHTAQIEAKIAQARFMTESKSVEQRLAEVDDLCRRGVISDSERAEARARILADG